MLSRQIHSICADGNSVLHKMLRRMLDAYEDFIPAASANLPSAPYL